jgi:hypothetical protein
MGTIVRRCAWAAEREEGHFMKHCASSQGLIFLSVQ